jgi:hypothetical protein
VTMAMRKALQDSPSLGFLGLTVFSGRYFIHHGLDSSLSGRSVMMSTISHKTCNRRWCLGTYHNILFCRRSRALQRQCA